MKVHSYLPAVLVFLACWRLGLADQPTVKPLEKPRSADAKPITVPFETLKSGHMAVMIKVNGKGPYRVIFDTGAPLHLLNNKLAKEVGLLKDAPTSMFPFLGTIAEVKMNKLQVGSAEAANQQAIVMDHPLVEMMSKKLGPLYGIVGFPFFARYRMTIDYQAEKLTLVPSGYKPPGNVLRSMETTMLQLMSASSQPAKVLAPAAQWGVTAGKKADDDQAGVDIQAVLAGSSAAEAGLKPGDRLLTIDGRWTDSLPDLYEIASHLKPGAAVPLGIQRGGKEMELKIKLRAGL
jgi:hypothetical protein